MKKQVIFIVLVVLVGLVSCKRNLDDIPTYIGKTSGLNVPKDFNWATTVDISLEVALPSEGLFPLKSRLLVYKDNPLEGAGQLIASGSISPELNFKQSIRVPAYLTKLYLLLDASVGGQTIAELDITGTQLNYVFPASTKTMKFKSVDAVQEEGPGCDDCDVTVSGNGTVVIKQGKTYCVTENFTGKVTFQTWNGGGTLKVCGGTAVISENISLGTNSYIIVTQGGSLTVNGLQMWGTGNGVKVYANSSLEVKGSLSTVGAFANHGTMIIRDGLTVQQLTEPFVNTGVLTNGSAGVNLNNAIMQNYGSFTSNGNFKLNSGSSMTNDGTLITANAFEINGSQMSSTGSITVNAGHFSINSGSIFTNEGSVEVSAGNFNINSNPTTNHGSIVAGGKISFNAGGNFLNTCSMICQELAEFNSGNIVFDGGYLRSETRIQINGGAATVLKNGSMLSTKLFELYGNIQAQQSSSSMKATTEFRMSSQTISGPVELATDNLNILSNTPASQHFVNGATVVAIGEEQNFLPVTACNPEGAGSVIITDMDGDGVPDDLDAFPNDPDKAFVSWYPNENDFSTIAFEDLWPGMGDFDFNDVVVIQQYQMITNAQNELVEMHAKFRLMAAGASLNNGFAVALDIQPDKIQSVTGGSIVGSAVNMDAKGYESGHTNQTVLIILDAINDLYPGTDFLNTVANLPYVETDTIQVKLILEEAVANYGVAPFNPFIFINQERGKEVHLLDFAPTALVNSEFFGMWDDSSEPAAGSYYKTENNLPWAIEIPVTFDYPYEKVDILTVYLKFAAWASSGGAEYPDWYLDLSGYRNNALIYQKPE